MRIFALELNNDIKGISERKEYIETLIASLPSPDIVLLPEMAICSYMPSQAAWKYADDSGTDTADWAIKIAKKYDTYLGVGYIDFDRGDYYNRYMIAGKEKVFGIVTKSEGEAAVFKRGWYDNIISTPKGNIAVGICYDARRKHFYENIKDKAVSLIVFPHGSPAGPKKVTEEKAANDFLCKTYLEAFGVPVIYINSVGKLEYMPGVMGAMMRLFGFCMKGKTEIYSTSGEVIDCDVVGAKGLRTALVKEYRKKDIDFWKDDLTKENLLFRLFVLKPDIKIGMKRYQKGLKKIGSQYAGY